MTMPHRPDSTRSAAVVIPIRMLDQHGAPIVVRRPGRPRRVETVPTYSDELYGAELLRRVSDAIGLDAIVVESLGDDPCSLVEKTMHAVAREAAALLWDRQRAQMEGKAEAQRISSRRVAALVRISELCVLAEQLRRDGGEPKPEHVAAITRMITADVEDTIEDVAPPETAAAFTRKLHAKLLAAGLSQESVSTPTATTASP